LNSERGGLNPERGGLNSERGGLNPERGGLNPERGGLNPERGIFDLDQVRLSASICRGFQGLPKRPLRAPTRCEER